MKGRFRGWNRATEEHTRGSWGHGFIPKLYYESKQLGYNRHINFCSGIISESNFQVQAETNEHVKLTRHLTDPINASTTVEVKNTYTNMSKANRFIFNQEILNPLRQSYTPESTHMDPVDPWHPERLFSCTKPMGFSGSMLVFQRGICFNEVYVDILNQCGTISPAGKLHNFLYNREVWDGPAAVLNETLRVNL